MTKPSKRLENQMKAYAQGRAQGRDGAQAQPEQHSDERIRVAYEAGHGYGAMEKRHGSAANR